MFYLTLWLSSVTSTEGRSIWVSLVKVLVSKVWWYKEVLVRKSFSDRKTSDTEDTMDSCIGAMEEKNKAEKTERYLES